jgi:nucleotide-binding universal stress UspA family protein
VGVIVVGVDGSEGATHSAVREAAARAAELEPSVDYEEVVVEGQAAKALLSSAKDADLLVMGRRGRGSFREMLLGSISRQVTVHATCPLVIVPPPGRDRGKIEVGA